MPRKTKTGAKRARNPHTVSPHLRAAADRLSAVEHRARENSLKILRLETALPVEVRRLPVVLRYGRPIYGLAEFDEAFAQFKKGNGGCLGPGAKLRFAEQCAEWEATRAKLEAAWKARNAVYAAVGITALEKEYEEQIEGELIAAEGAFNIAPVSTVADMALKAAWSAYMNSDVDHGDSGYVMAMSILGGCERIGGAIAAPAEHHAARADYFKERAKHPHVD